MIAQRRPCWEQDAVYAQGENSSFGCRRHGSRGKLLGLRVCAVAQGGKRVQRDVRVLGEKGEMTLESEPSPECGSWPIRVLRSKSKNKKQERVDML